jgi:hypothetical protein
MLSGRHGEGHVSKVDLRFWHRLTYKTKWDGARLDIRPLCKG